MKKFFGAIAFVLSGIAKTVWYALVTLGLWLPALFCAAFFIGTAATHTALTNGIMAIFYAGLALTVAGGVGLAMLYAPKRKAKRKIQKAAKKNAARAERTEEPFSVQQPVPRETTKEMQQSVPRETTENAQPYQMLQSVPRETTKNEKDYADLERKYFGPQTRSVEPQTDEPPTDALSEEAARLWARLEGAEPPDEQPLVFRMRGDENLFVYEFSDRYQFWRRTRAGMELERTEYKTEQERKEALRAR